MPPLEEEEWHSEYFFVNFTIDRRWMENAGAFLSALSYVDEVTATLSD